MKASKGNSVRRWKADVGGRRSRRPCTQTGQEEAQSSVAGGGDEDDDDDDEEDTDDKVEDGAGAVHLPERISTGKGAEWLFGGREENLSMRKAASRGFGVASSREDKIGCEERRSLVACKAEDWSKRGAERSSSLSDWGTSLWYIRRADDDCLEDEAVGAKPE